MKVIKIKKSNHKARIEIGYTTANNDSSFPYASRHNVKYRNQVNTMIADGVIVRDFISYSLELE